MTRRERCEAWVEANILCTRTKPLTPHGLVKELESFLDEQAPTWTSEKPTVEGWWWYREGQTESVMQITNGHDGILYGWLHENVYPLHVYHGEWSDRPIPGPGE